MPRSLAYLEKALAEGSTVIGASSLGHDLSRENYPVWTHLPYVTAPEFDNALRLAIEEFNIGGIYTPNMVVWNYINARIKESFPGVKLVNASPAESEIAPYSKALKFGSEVFSEPLVFPSQDIPKISISKLKIAALFHHADIIPGMCDHEKIRGLCEIFRYAPSGDIVEIGTWWGKSAFVLNWLGSCYNVGKLLCVDPWSSEYLIQNDEKGLVDGMRDEFNAEQVLTIFQLNILPYAHNTVNYLRLPSVEAATQFRRNNEVATLAFGKTTYQGKIAVLHVDGNHSFENASADVNAWADLVLPGGWIIIDDYVWPYGDGPKRVGDEFLRDNFNKIELAFVMGSALYIRMCHKPIMLEGTRSE
jgi:hypothetical protein